VESNSIVVSQGSTPSIAKSEDKKPLPEFLNQESRETTYDEVLQNQGSRHRSALSYVMQVPSSFAFVISQDSGVPAFHNPDNGTILCEKDMHVLD